MKGYFNRKPMNVDEVKAVIKEGVRRHAKPVEIESLGRIVLPLDDYIRFCGNLCAATTISSNPMPTKRYSPKTARSASWSALPASM